MTVLRLVTPGPPALPHHGPRHAYRCSCPGCVEDRATRQPARCACDRPAVYADPTANGDLTCLHCGRPPASLEAAA